MLKKLIFTNLILILTLTSFNSVFAQTNEPQINFFYSNTCPFCAKEKEFLKDLQEKYPQVKIEQYEVVSNIENREILIGFYEKYKVSESEMGRVPVTFTPTKYFIGFDENIGREIESCLIECIGGKATSTQMIKIPFIGNIDLSKMSLPVITVILGALDGLNPCAMWILIFLIVLLLNTKSRKRLWLIGGTFLLASGVVYFLILGAWLKLFLAISYVNITRILIGLFAVGFGVWQIKNFVTYKPGTCQIVDGTSSFQDKMKNNLQNRAQKIATSPFTLGILFGTIILAFGVNLVEFFCSAGLPAIFTRTLALNNLTSFEYYFYLFLYTLIFILDDIIILTIAIITLKRINITEKYNYWSTLIGGILILTLGLLLIFKPHLLMFS